MPRGTATKSLTGLICIDGCFHTPICILLLFKVEGKKRYYLEVTIDDEILEVGDCVSVSPDNPTEPVYLARLVCSWQSGKVNRTSAPPVSTCSQRWQCPVVVF